MVDSGRRTCRPRCTSVNLKSLSLNPTVDSNSNIEQTMRSGGVTIVHLSPDRPPRIPTHAMSAQGPFCSPVQYLYSTGRTRRRLELDPGRFSLQFISMGHWIMMFVFYGPEPHCMESCYDSNSGHGQCRCYHVYVMEFDTEMFQLNAGLMRVRFRAIYWLSIGSVIL